MFIIFAAPEHPDSIRKVFHRAHGGYANWFNKKYGLVGHLWQERPFSCVLSEGRLRNAIRYVENNPVRAGIVAAAEDYRWSSARAHCRGDLDVLLDPAHSQAIAGWAEWLRGNPDARVDDLIRECTSSGRPCGDEAFLIELERLTGRSLRPKRRGPKPTALEASPKLDFGDSQA
jgi:putative transposase